MMEERYNWVSTAARIDGGYLQPVSSKIPNEIPQVSVSPSDLFLMDVEKNMSSQWFFRFKPLDYDVIITLSGYVITKLLKWALSSGFVVINGSYSIQDGRKRRTFNVTKEKENPKT